MVFFKNVCGLFLRVDPFDQDHSNRSQFFPASLIPMPRPLTPPTIQYLQPEMQVLVKMSPVQNVKRCPHEGPKRQKKLVEKIQVKLDYLSE